MTKTLLTKTLNINVLKVFYVLLFVFSTIRVSAQPPTFEDDIEDETEAPAAPINDSIALAMAAGIFLGFYFISKQAKPQQQK